MVEVHFDFWNVVYPSGSFYDIKLGSLVVSEDEGKLHQFKAQVTQFRTKAQFHRLKVGALGGQSPFVGSHRKGPALKPWAKDPIAKPDLSLTVSSR